MPKWKTPGQNEPTHFYQKTQMKSSQDYACSSRLSLDEVFTPYGRERVTAGVDYQTAANAANSALDPLSLPTLDAYGRLELADWMRATK